MGIRAMQAAFQTMKHHRAGFMARLFGIFAPARSRKSPSGKSSRCQCGVNCTLRRIRRGSMVCRWQLATPRMGTKSVLSSAVRSKSEGMIWVIRAMLILVRNLLYLPNCTPFSGFPKHELIPVTNIYLDYYSHANDSTLRLIDAFSAGADFTQR